jgi:DnaJ-class molecular chaperone
MVKYRKTGNLLDIYITLHTGKPCTVCKGTGDLPYDGHNYRACTACNESGLSKVHNGTVCKVIKRREVKPNLQVFNGDGMIKYAEDKCDNIEHYRYESEGKRDDHIEIMISNGFSHLMNHGVLCASYQVEKNELEIGLNIQLNEGVLI